MGLKCAKGGFFGQVVVIFRCTVGAFESRGVDFGQLGRYISKWNKMIKLII